MGLSNISKKVWQGYRTFRKKAYSAVENFKKSADRFLRILEKERLSC
jgi:hypothetical protein